MASLLLLTILGSYVNIPIISFPSTQLVHDQELIVNGIPTWSHVSRRWESQ